MAGSIVDSHFGLQRDLESSTALSDRRRLLGWLLGSAGFLLAGLGGGDDSASAASSSSTNIETAESGGNASAGGSAVGPIDGAG